MAAEIAASSISLAAESGAVERSATEPCVLRVSKSFSWYWPTTSSNRAKPIPTQRSDPNTSEKKILTNHIDWIFSWSIIELPHSKGQAYTSLTLHSGAQEAVIAYKVLISNQHATSDTPPTPYVSQQVVTLMKKGITFTPFKQNENFSFPKNKQHAELAISLSIEVLKITPTIPSPECSIINDIQSLIEGNKEFQDITLLVGPNDSREEIKANKMMLMARSPVFAVMFQSEMMEKATGTVEITDIKANEFKIMLRFIYTDDIPDLNDLKTIEDVIIAANKYQIIRLKALCEGQLLRYINIENAAHLLAFANQYCALKFKDYLVEFIASSIEQCKRVMETTGWQEVRDQGSSLVEEVFRRHMESISQPPRDKIARNEN